MGKRVVVTGMGMVTALGHNVTTTWQKLLQGESGVSFITNYDSQAFRVHIGAEVKNFDPTAYLDPEEVQKTEAYIHYAIAAAHEALQQARLTNIANYADEIGVCIGSCLGGLTAFENAYTVLMDKGPQYINAQNWSLTSINAVPALISIRYGFKGPLWTLASAHTTGSNTIGEAAEIIRRGDAKVMLAGGTEKSIIPIAMAAFDNMRALTRDNADPERACRPFDATRSGFVMGEGAGILLLEELEFAQQRGATILAELIGYGTATDAYHITEPEPHGYSLIRAMQLALRKAHLQPEDIQYINAHGTSTLYNDRIETLAIKTCFGPHAYQIPISATKSMIGHTLGASGSIGAIVSILSINHNLVHPTINLSHPDPDCDLDYVPHTARSLPIDIAMSNAVGFGGHNTSLIFRRYCCQEG